MTRSTPARKVKTVRIVTPASPSSLSTRWRASHRERRRTREGGRGRRRRARPVGTDAEEASAEREQHRDRDDDEPGAKRPQVEEAAAHDEQHADADERNRQEDAGLADERLHRHGDLAADHTAVEPEPEDDRKEQSEPAQPQAPEVGMLVRAARRLLRGLRAVRSRACASSSRRVRHAGSVRGSGIGLLLGRAKARPYAASARRIDGRRANDSEGGLQAAHPKSEDPALRARSTRRQPSRDDS